MNGLRFVLQFLLRWFVPPCFFACEDAANTLADRARIAIPGLMLGSYRAWMMRGMEAGWIPRGLNRVRTAPVLAHVCDFGQRVGKGSLADWPDSIDTNSRYSDAPIAVR